MDFEVQKWSLWLNLLVALCFVNYLNSKDLIDFSVVRHSPSNQMGGNFGIAEALHAIVVDESHFSHGGEGLVNLFCCPRNISANEETMKVTIICLKNQIGR